MAFTSPLQGLKGIFVRAAAIGATKPVGELSPPDAPSWPV